MHLRSLAYRTDLALLELAGSKVEDRGTHLVVRTPQNPTFYWGNFLLLARPPAADGGEHWLDTFEREFPGTRHRAFGVDGTDGSTADLAAFDGQRGDHREEQVAEPLAGLQPPDHSESPHGGKPR